MKVYRGRRGANGTVVTVNDQPLAPRTDLGSFSETGFEWGYNGGGPNQLALAILSDYFGDGAKALNLYKGFCQSVISMIKGDEWTLSDTQIDNSLENVADPASERDRVLPGDVLAVHLDRAGRGFEEAVRQLEKGGLAAAGGTEENEGLALAYVKRDVVDGEALAPIEGLGDVLEREHGSSSGRDGNPLRDEGARRRRRPWIAGAQPFHRISGGCMQRHRNRAHVPTASCSCVRARAGTAGEERR